MNNIEERFHKSSKQSNTFYPTSMLEAIADTYLNKISEEFIQTQKQQEICEFYFFKKQATKSEKIDFNKAGPAHELLPLRIFEMNEAKTNEIKILSKFQISDDIMETLAKSISKQGKQSH